MLWVLTDQFLIIISLYLQQMSIKQQLKRHANKKVSQPKEQNLLKNNQNKFKLLIQKDNSSSSHSTIATKYSRPIVFQFKNAIFYGLLDGHQKITDIGIVIYDNGNILIANFISGIASGMYFFYDFFNMMCLYGNIRNNKLEGKNYVLSRKNALLMANFINGQIDNKKQIWIKNKNKIEELKQYLGNAQRMTPHFNNRQIIGYSRTPQQDLINPSDFISRMMILKIKERSSNQQPSEPQQVFQLYQINREQTYFGRLQKGKPVGYGIIFLKEWPVCYGHFKDGQLEGLARVEQNPLLILDGLFESSNMKLGWVLDFKRDCMSFGMNRATQSFKNKFQLIEQYKGIEIQKIGSFRKSNHLKSLFYKNSFLQQLLITQSWLPSYLDQIKHEHIINDILQSFNPSYISEISRVAEMSSNRLQKDLIELIREHNEQKQSYLKVSKILQERLKKYESEFEKIQVREQTNDKYFYSLLNHSRSKSKQSKYSSPHNKVLDRSKTKQKFKPRNNILIREQQQKRDRASNSTLGSKKLFKDHHSSTKKNLNLDQIYSKYLTRENR